LIKIKSTRLAKDLDMVARHSVISNTSNKSSTFKNFLAFVASFVVLTLTPIAPAKAEVSYGPIKVGQTLWEVAEEIRPDKSISVEQLIYAIYNLNPDAFQSGNMNLLKKGAYLNIPDSNTLINASSAEAKKLLSEHTHALQVLRVDAKQLRTAKANTRNHKQRVKTLQKKLAKYRHKSRAWNDTYRKLVSSKRKHAKSKRNVAKLRGLLLEKATLKYTARSKKSVSETNVNKVDKRLSKIQSSLANLNQSNNKLLEKMQKLETLNHRVMVLEDELGKNDELVIQLQKTLETTQQAIKEQKLENEKFLQRFKELEAKNNTPANNDTDPEDEKEFIIPPYMDAPESSTSLQDDLKTENQIPAALFQGQASIQDAISDGQTHIHAIKTVFNHPEITSAVTPDLLKTGGSNLMPTSGINSSSLNNTRNHQRLVIQSPLAETSSGNRINLLKDKIIIFGGILNCLILIFVIFRFFPTKKTGLNKEDIDSIPLNSYKPWQEREKPKQAGF